MSYGRFHQLHYAETTPSTSQYLYVAYSRPERMAKSGGISTDTSNVVVTADTITQPGASARFPFAGLKAGSLVRFYGVGTPNGIGGAPTIRKVATDVGFGNGSTVTLTSAVTLTACTAYDIMRVSRGLGDETSPLGTTIGWCDISHWRKPTLTIGISTLPTEGFAWSIEFRDPVNQIPSPWATGQVTAVTDTPLTIYLDQGMSSVRFGIKALDTGSVDGGSITASLMDAAVNP